MEEEAGGSKERKKHATGEKKEPRGKRDDGEETKNKVRNLKESPSLTDIYMVVPGPA